MKWCLVVAYVTAITDFFIFFAYIDSQAIQRTCNTVFLDRTECLHYILHTFLQGFKIPAFAFLRLSVHSLSPRLLQKPVPVPLLLFRNHSLFRPRHYPAPPQPQLSPCTPFCSLSLTFPSSNSGNGRSGHLPLGREGLLVSFRAWLCEWEADRPFRERRDVRANLARHCDGQFDCWLRGVWRLPTHGLWEGTGAVSGLRLVRNSKRDHPRGFHQTTLSLRRWRH